MRQLAGLGARVVGVEISEQQLATAVASDGDTGARYMIGSGQQLPLADASVDLAVFMRTLHHVPPAELLDALREAGRVLRRDGLVYVAEPLAEGDYFELVSLVDDEREAREAAQAALREAGRAGLEHVTAVEYDVAGKWPGSPRCGRGSSASIPPGPSSSMRASPSSPRRWGVWASRASRPASGVSLPRCESTCCARGSASDGPAPPGSGVRGGLRRARPGSEGRAQAGAAASSSVKAARSSSPGVQRAAATLACTWSGLVEPAITVDTTSCDSSHPIATSVSEMPRSSA